MIDIYMFVKEINNINITYKSLKMVNKVVVGNILSNISVPLGNQNGCLFDLSLPTYR